MFWLFTFGCKEPRITRSILKYSTLIQTFNIMRAKQRLGYVPRISVREGIERSVKWYLSATAPARCGNSTAGSHVVVVEG